MNIVQRKTVRILVVFLLSIAMLSACSNTKSGDSGNTSGDSNKQVTFENAPTVKFMIIDNTASKRAESKQDDIDNSYSRYIFEQTGVKLLIDRQPENGYEQKVQLSLASSSGIDLMFLSYNSEVSQNIARSGALESVNDAIGQYKHVKDAYDDAYWESVSFDENKFLLGNMYLFPRATNATLIRQDWLDDLNLPMPKTVDDLYNVAKAFVENKPDGQLTFGLTGRKDLSYFFAISGAYGIPNTHPEMPYLYIDKQAKNVVLWQTTDAARAYYKKVQQFWNDGLVDREAVTNSGDQFWTKINNGQVGIINHQPVSVGWLTSSIRTAQESSKPTLVVVPPLTGTGYPNSFGTEGAYQNSDPFDGFYGIPKGNKNIANTMKVLDFLCSEEGMEFNKFGLEGIEHDVVDGEKVLNQERSSQIGFLGDYAITGDPKLVKEGRYFDISVKTLAGAGDPLYDTEEGPLERVNAAYDLVVPTLVPGQEWGLVVPRMAEEDKYPDYITTMTSLYIKMVTGEYDANSDTDWNRFLNEVDKTGINVILKAKEEYLKANANHFFE